MARRSACPTNCATGVFFLRPGMPGGRPSVFRSMARSRPSSVSAGTRCRANCARPTNWPAAISPIADSRPARAIAPFAARIVTSRRTPMRCRSRLSRDKRADRRQPSLPGSWRRIADHWRRRGRRLLALRASGRVDRNRALCRRRRPRADANDPRTDLTRPSRISRSSRVEGGLRQIRSTST